MFFQTSYNKPAFRLLLLQGKKEIICRPTSRYSNGLRERQSYVHPNFKTTP